MAQGILGNIIEDKFVSIPIEDYDEYKMLLKGRQIIVDTFELKTGAQSPSSTK